MNRVRIIRRALGVAAAAAGSLIGFMLFAPSAFAMVIRPIGDGAGPASSPQPASSVIHNVVAGGMAGWEIALIAAATALLGATLAVFVERLRVSQRSIGVSAA